MVTTVITAVAAARRHTNGSEDNCEDDGGPRLSGPLRKLRRQSSRLRNLLPLLGGTGGIGSGKPVEQVYCACLCCCVEVEEGLGVESVVVWPF